MTFGDGQGERFLPTPSTRRATRRRLPLLLGAPHFYPRPPRGGRRSPPVQDDDPRGISTHALHEEGDGSVKGNPLISVRFLPTPSTRRATRPTRGGTTQRHISTHALHEEGDLKKASTPPTAEPISTHALHEEGDLSARFVSDVDKISTHALHEEGDVAKYNLTEEKQRISTHALHEEGDRHFRQVGEHRMVISTHALHEEGDRSTRYSSNTRSGFLPTPSTRRATPSNGHMEPGTRFLPPPSTRRATVDCLSFLRCVGISTHALHEEGDRLFHELPAGSTISTHALHEEGDLPRDVQPGQSPDFYPRPPRGGRHFALDCDTPKRSYFYPRPPRGGRR